jgi:hypothetical protein
VVYFLNSKFPEQWFGINITWPYSPWFFPSHVHQGCWVAVTISTTLPEYAERIRATVATVILNLLDKYGLKMNTHTPARPLTMLS